MTTISHGPSRVVQKKREGASQLLVPEMWAFLAIVLIWLACWSTQSSGRTS